jgi:hypothetical protein
VLYEYNAVGVTADNNVEFSSYVTIAGICIFEAISKITFKD